MKNYFIAFLCLLALTSISADRNYFQLEAVTNEAYHQLAEYLTLHCIKPRKVCTLYAEYSHFSAADWMSSGLDAYLSIKFPETHLLQLKTATGCWPWINTKTIPCMQSAGTQKSNIIFLPPKLKDQNIQLVTNYLHEKTKYQLIMKMRQPKWLYDKQLDSYLFTIKK